MPVEMLKEYFQKKDEWEKIQMRIVLQTAPFLKGMKESALIYVPNCFLEDMVSFFHSLLISSVVLYRSKKNTMIFLYREEKLQKLLSEPCRVEFLSGYGYAAEKNDEYLHKLASHMRQYYDKEREFPHEIGIFLGYPKADVEGFIANDGKNYLFSGYWKVYDNVPGAQSVFHQYDMARKKAVYQLLYGIPLRKIVTIM